MSSIDRSLHDGLLRFDLEQERRLIAEEPALARSGRSARSLIKAGALRVTLVSIAAGGSISSHSVDGPALLQGVAGSVTCAADGEDHVLATGEILYLEPGMPHNVTSETGGTFLLTVTRETEGAGHPGATVR